MDHYLVQLVARLFEGMARLPAPTRQRHARFLTAKQNPDGGFSGREGPSDLYYTGFALRGLAVLDALAADVGKRAAGFLTKSLETQAGLVDFFSLLYSSLLLQTSLGLDSLSASTRDWPERVAAFLETLRTKDGGYAKAPGGHSGSTYQSFLVALCYQMLGRDIPKPDELLRFVESRRREDGGFVEIHAMRRSGTNPTAAGIGLLQILKGESLTADEKKVVIEFLANMPSSEGGLRANDRIPLADLLSTFTGCWTLAQLGALDRIDKTAVLRYAQSLEMHGGGFRGGLWDSDVDVEYTFYGLGCLALLSQ
ncbi:MAG: geranyl transferase [Gemmataceae bacterium]|nr:geranyl transferase [Gemmataceae bacterium]MCI0739658.1 geranyl transferase [Gemmataceae bacterium]